jgi:hypothetical protein
MVINTIKIALTVPASRRKRARPMASEMRDITV